MIEPLTETVFAPEVLMKPLPINVAPAAIATGPLPAAEPAELPISSVPAETVVPPV